LIEKPQRLLTAKIAKIAKKGQIIEEQTCFLGYFASFEHAKFLRDRKERHVKSLYSANLNS